MLGTSKLNSSGKHQPLVDFTSSSFNINIIFRILSILREHGDINRTNLAGKSGLNYGRCVKYVDMLITLGWIKTVFANGTNISITDKGIEFLNSLPIV